MTMERLTTAARAAGFATAMNDWTDSDRTGSTAKAGTSLTRQLPPRSSPMLASAGGLFATLSTSFNSSLRRWGPTA